MVKTSSLKYDTKWFLEIFWVLRWLNVKPLYSRHLAHIFIACRGGNAETSAIEPLEAINDVSVDWPEGATLTRLSLFTRHAYLTGDCPVAWKFLAQTIQLIGQISILHS